MLRTTFLGDQVGIQQPTGGNVAYNWWLRGPLESFDVIIKTTSVVRPSEHLSKNQSTNRKQKCFYIRFSYVLAQVIILLLLLSCVNAVAKNKSGNRIIVDNFEKPGKLNSLGLDFGAFSDTGGLGYCYLFFIQNKARDKEELGKSKYSLYIQWDTSKKGAYSGYWSELGHLNLAGYSYLTFYIKGIRGGEKFKVGLRGKKEATYETKIPIDDIIGRSVSTKWQKVIIPLKLFKAVQDWRDVNIFSINFENAIGSERGALMIDNIAFER
jgi:Carbohydrate binding domain 30